MVLQNEYFRLLSVIEFTTLPKETEAKPRGFHRISLRLSGRADFCTEEQRFTAEEGDLLYVPKDMEYRIHQKEQHVIALHFETDENSNRLQLFGKAGESVRSLFEELALIWSEKRPGYYLRAMAVFYRILDEMNRRFVLGEKTTYRRIEPAVEYIHGHYGDSDLSVERICEICSLSDTAFRRLFSEAFGINPLKYIQKLRIERAAELLKSGQHSVERVAETCGFSDAKYFATVFKKYKHCPPSHYQ